MGKDWLAAVMKGKDLRMKLNVRQQCQILGKKKITVSTNVLQVRHGQSVQHIPWLNASWDTAFSFGH